MSTLDDTAKDSQCADCGEAGEDGNLVVRWNGQELVLSCPIHGDNPRYRLIDYIHEKARFFHLESEYGAGLTLTELGEAQRRTWPMKVPIDDKTIDDLFG